MKEALNFAMGVTVALAWAVWYWHVDWHGAVAFSFGAWIVFVWKVWRARSA